MRTLEGGRSSVCADSTEGSTREANPHARFRSIQQFASYSARPSAERYVTLIGFNCEISKLRHPVFSSAGHAVRRGCWRESGRLASPQS